MGILGSSGSERCPLEKQTTWELQGQNGIHH